jgi:tetratricopeptide (TPR) repeat protein
METSTAQENYKNSIHGEIGNLMVMAETAVEATNWEEALQFYNKALEKDITNSDAWLGKGIAIVYTSTVGDIKTKEAIAYWKNAIKHSPNSEAMGKRVAKEINSVVNGFYPVIENHYLKFHDLNNSFQELVSKFIVLESALGYAIQLDNSKIEYLLTGFFLCRRVVLIPDNQAVESSGKALADGLMGQFSSNKYSRKSALKNAGEEFSKAQSRKKEIEKASYAINRLMNEYISKIITLDPSNKEINDWKNKLKLATSEKQEKEAKQKYYYYLGGGGLIGLFSVSLLFNFLKKTTSLSEDKEIAQLFVFLGLGLGALIGHYVHKSRFKKSI